MSKSLAFVGRQELSRYFVHKWRSLNATGGGVTVELALRRRLMSEVLTTFLPTLLICAVSFSTHHYQVAYFEVGIKNFQDTYHLCTYKMGKNRNAFAFL